MIRLFERFFQKGVFHELPNKPLVIPIPSMKTWLQEEFLLQDISSRWDN